MKRIQLLFFFVSFLVVASAQPDWSALTSILASSIGYALFWQGLLYTKRRKIRFVQATVWFALVQAVQMSWLTSDRYVGWYIFIFAALLFLVIGMQFGLISLFVEKSRLTVPRMLAISGGWALFEWVRLLFLSGYSLNPTGLALSSTLYGMQMAAFFGVLGMSFWVFFTNLLALKMFRSFSLRCATLWGMALLTPYIYGWAHVAFHKKQMEIFPDRLSALLVQTSLYPEAKLPFNGSQPLPPDVQWERILSLLFPYRGTNHDLIVMSEAVVPYGANIPIYPIETVEYAFSSFFEQKKPLPPVSSEYVDNIYWAQTLANQLSADVVLGLEDFERNAEGAVENVYNAAFLLRPHATKTERYEKRVLVPMGEYIPFNWCKKILAKYGIQDSYTAGAEAKVFQTKRVPVGLSICYEETFGHLMRQNRLKGAGLLINLTNDVWYPHSRLPMVHFLHGRLRAVEAGTPLVRSCNTGVTGGVDSLGRLVGMLDCESAFKDSPADALSLSIPLYHYPTFYTRCGDLPVLVFSALCFGLFFIRNLFKRNSFSINDLDVSLLRKN